MLKFEAVTEENFAAAAAVYGASWKESHRGICSPAFLERRDHAGYLQSRMEGLWLVSDGKPVGVFRVCEGILSDLYIHPDRQSRGYGTACVRFAVGQCTMPLGLTVLSSNEAAVGLYRKIGFRFTGRDTLLRPGLWEREMIYTENHNG